MESTALSYGLTKEALQDLYVNRGLSIRQIATMCGCKWGVVQRILVHHHLNDGKSRTPTYLTRTHPFDATHYQVVLGTLLGDGCLASNPPGYQLRLCHCESQLDYLLWKKNLLPLLFANSPVAPFRAGGFAGNGTRYRVYSSNHQDLILIRNLLYPEGQKVITDRLLNSLNELALCVWYLDDGWLHRKYGYCGIATHSFSRPENELLAEWFGDRWGISASIDTTKMRGREFSHLRFLKRSTPILMQLLKGFDIPLCVQYKLSSSLPSASPCRASTELAK